jgi:aminopeptidase N
LMKEEVVETISHAIAKQWFGNLVTVEWWSE